MKTLAGGWTLVGGGVLLGLGSSLALAIAGPSRFDPARSCRYRFDVDRTFTAHEQQFPPHTTCVRDDGQAFEYLSSGTTLVGAVLLAVAALSLLAGVALLAVTWLRRDALPEPPPAGSRQLHLWLALLLGLTVSVAVTGVFVALYIFLGVFAAAFVVVPALLGATMLAALFDKAAGPNGAGRRRRATTVAVLGGAGAIAVEWVALATDVLPLGDWRLLSIPLATALCAVVVAAQHVLAPAPHPVAAGPGR
ncbi:hypothetical protein OHA72_59525 [Dactylosporangium sp. NBC_01737]|uniref:hypothetical protein n=1 Tax=Dactylosporangium sp. NBC_01737 TaxID=2975959 RepID=UPI002E105CBA|nr:hypothetical protein OHA72_59525 [Dactylosporangium sp. NBC_01737]